MAQSGLDWIIVDMEHGAIDLGAAHALIVATSGTPLVPLVRVPAGAAWHAKAPLDFGAMGICFPMTTRRSDAEAAVRAVRYPPIGDRLWGPFYAPPRWNLSMREHLDRADQAVLAIGTIEHVDALTQRCGTRSSASRPPSCEVRSCSGARPRASTKATEMIARGYQALVIGFDWSLLQRGIASMMDAIRR